jgi:CsoR family transcriptional regulator, copper-sensing transcriptional repressor
VSEPSATGHGYLPHKAELLTRLARVEGQVRGVARMLDEERYCIDVLTQLAAIDTALEAVALKVLDEHVKHCVGGALASGDPKAAEAKTEELLDAVRRFAKTR